MPLYSRGREIWLFFELATPSQSTVRCALYRTDAGLELRLQMWSLPPERVQSVESYGTARELAAQWREELIHQRQYRNL